MPSPTPCLHEPHLKQHEENGAPIVIDDEHNKKEKDFTNITDWSEHAHPELKPLLKNVKEVNFNSWLKVKLMSALMSIPIPIKQAGVGMKKKGQGVYFYPTNDENDGEAPNDNCAAILWIHVRKKPDSIVLFDEVEKAHPDVFNLFVQILGGRTYHGFSGRNVR